MSDSGVGIVSGAAGGLDVNDLCQPARRARFALNAAVRRLSVLTCASLAVVLSLRARDCSRRQAAFVIVLENKDYEQSFGASSPASYLAQELPARGPAAAQYYGTSHVSLATTSR